MKKLLILLGLCMIFLAACDNDPFKGRTVVSTDELQDVDCEMIKDVALKDVCISEQAISGNNPGACESIQEELRKVECLVETGLKDITFCSGITGGLASEKCKFGVTVNIADPQGCNQLQTISKFSSDNYQESCFFRIASATKNPQLCERISNTDTKQACIRNLIVQEARADDCQLIEGSYERNNCYRRIAEKTGEWQLCQRIDYDADADYCFRNTAKNIQDVEPCKYIKGPSDQQTCIGNVPVNDQSFCDGLTAFGAKDECYMQLAITKNDDSLCDLITSEFVQNLCTSSIA